MVELKSPEIETEEEENEEKEFDSKKIKEIIEEIKINPYSYICNYVESIYPNVGRKVFKILSLMPVSLIIPDLPFMGKTIRTNINTLFLAQSGSGKSSLAELFSLFTLNPLQVESITPTKLETAIEMNPKCSIIVGDATRLLKDQIIIKILEGVLGEEKRIRRQTMRKDLDLETDAVAFLSGTPQDLSHYLSGGLIFRLCPIIVLYTEKEHADIGRHIKDRIGRDGEEDLVEESIRLFYKELELIQEGKHNIPKVKGFIIDKSFSDNAYSEWEKLTTKMVKETKFNFIRGFHEFFRFLVSHAFLNIHNRKIEKNKLIIEKEDFMVALSLMKQIINTQYDILHTERYAKSIRTLTELQTILRSNKIDEKYKSYLKYLTEVKGNRVVTKV